ncbi:hypothetical protein K438DRAFT_1970354 [Mycena galopus ATCC 62051]|nr:hypothetical protein K438DRAFT_1970354 [Mycena galopus ATCC 62051]
MEEKAAKKEKAAAKHQIVKMRGVEHKEAGSTNNHTKGKKRGVYGVGGLAPRTIQERKKALKDKFKAGATTISQHAWTPMKARRRQRSLKSPNTHRIVQRRKTQPGQPELEPLRYDADIDSDMPTSTAPAPSAAAAGSGAAPVAWPPEHVPLLATLESLLARAVATTTALQLDLHRGHNTYAH